MAVLTVQFGSTGACYCPNRSTLQWHTPAPNNGTHLAMRNHKKAQDMPIPLYLEQKAGSNSAYVGRQLFPS